MSAEQVQRAALEEIITAHVIALAKVRKAVKSDPDNPALRGELIACEAQWAALRAILFRASVTLRMAGAA